MTIYDQHVHTFLSHDSIEQFENYLAIAEERGISHFVTTEHLDLSCQQQKKDVFVDVKKQERIIGELQKKYNVKILKGVEMGYKFSRINDMEKIINDNNYDVVVMSVHEDELHDCASQAFQKNRSADDVYSSYLDLYINMLENFSSFDIVGHIDYLLRYIDNITIENHEKKLSILLRLVIAKKKALEFNTRFLYQHNDDKYLKFIFQLYYELGGRKLSLGSDAHTSDVYFAGFEEAIDILKGIGFSHITGFQHNKEIEIPLEGVSYYKQAI